MIASDPRQSIFCIQTKVFSDLFIEIGMTKYVQNTLFQCINQTSIKKETISC